MVVKRVNRSKAKRGKKKPVARRKPSAKAAAPALPTEMSEPEVDISRYVILIYGRSGIGKTTLCASFPKAIFFSTEPGTKGLRRYEYNAENGGVQDWETLRQGISALEVDNGQHFKTVVIDTISVAYDLCAQWVCEKFGVEHMTDVGYGKAWAALKTEFTDQLFRIVRAGYGLVMTCHSQFSKISKHDGDEYDIIQPTLKNAALEVIKSVTDCMFYCEFVKRAGDTDAKRILITQGDDLVMAKARGDDWPRFLPMLEHNGYEVIRDAFAGEYAGLSADEIRMSKETHKSARASINASKAKKRMVKKGGQKAVRRNRRK